MLISVYWIVCSDQPNNGEKRNAASLFLNLEVGTKTGYHAIPSVLASLMAGKTSHIHGKTITWRLMQDGANGLAVISNPFHAQFEDVYHNVKEGTFAYKLEFRLQTQVGSPHRWIHLYVRCSRYVDKLMKDANFQRDVSVKVGIGPTSFKRMGVVTHAGHTPTHWRRIQSTLAG